MMIAAENHLVTSATFEHVICCSPPKPLFVIAARMDAGFQNPVIGSSSAVVAMHAKNFSPFWFDI
ncbi:MAG TPA: hypothetical protein VE959_04605 [Bryobacteraceae bacterium]|nr:hypothetical protein [Bryobacteraceae bacterium]